MSHSSSKRPSWEVPAGRRWPAWFFSVVLHAAGFFLAALLMDRVPRGAATAGDRHVGLAFVDEQRGERQYETAEQQQAREQPSAASSTSALASLSTPAAIGANVVPSEAVQSIQLSSVLPDGSPGVPLEGPPSLQVPSIAGSAATQGNDDRLSTAVHTSVFGAEGTGSKFLYVFDRSGSMAANGGRPLSAAKKELIASLQDLSETSQFQIVFYNERPSIFQMVPGQTRMIWADSQGIAAAERFVRAIAADGGTRHLEPLRLALGLQPDVIFFLTDADEPRLSDGELRTVRSWNAGTVVHAIEFGLGPQRRADNFLVRLARENGGKHIYVDVTDLQK